MDEQYNHEPQQAPVKQPFNKMLALSIGLVVIIVALIVVVLYLWSKNKTQMPVTIIDNTNNPIRVIHDPNQARPPVPTSIPPQSFPQESFVSVDWLPKWVPASVLSGTSPDYINKHYRIGKVKDGIYAGKDLYIEEIPGMITDYAHFVLDNDSPVYFYLDSVNIKIRGIDDIPETIVLPGTNYTLKNNLYASVPFSDIKTVWKVFSDPKLGNFYLSEQGCLVVELPDHTTATYDIVIPFVNKETRELEIKFTNGTENRDPYSYNRIIGCGALCMYLAEMDEAKLQPQVRLVEAGKVSNGETMYEFKDTNAPELKALYNDANTVAYLNESGGWPPQGKSKYSYEQFISYHPLLYWKDPIGRWIEFKSDHFQIAAEMCKPVIYLYPEKETEMSVKVFPNGGFTYTNPPYNGGWNVLAYPNGTVKDFGTNKIYPYLFWEGIGLNYPDQETGFVVKSSDINSFLTKKISLLGLEGREATDFLDYWVPRLQGLNKSYVKISFLKKEQMDEIAPLELSVKPNSVIRVMMTAKGLDSFEQLPQQELPLPQDRVGFSFVEWGGVVLK